MAYPSLFKGKILLADLQGRIDPLRILLESDVDQIETDDLQNFCNQYVYTERICTREAFSDFIEGRSLDLTENDGGYLHSMFTSSEARKQIYWWLIMVLLDDLGETAKDHALTIC